MPTKSPEKHTGCKQWCLSESRADRGLHPLSSQNGGPSSPGLPAAGSPGGDSRAVGPGAGRGGPGRARRRREAVREAAAGGGGQRRRAHVSPGSAAVRAAAGPVLAARCAALRRPPPGPARRERGARVRGERSTG